MKAELEKQSLELLNWLEQTIKTTAEFGHGQTPLFIQELLRYQYWISLTLFITGLIGIILSIWSGYVFVKWCIKDEGYNEENMAYVCVWMLPLFAFGNMITSNVEWIMIQLAPRLFLLEYVKELIKH